MVPRRIAGLGMDENIQPFPNGASTTEQPFRTGSAQRQPDTSTCYGVRRARRASGRASLETFPTLSARGRPCYELQDRSRHERESGLFHEYFFSLPLSPSLINAKLHGYHATRCRDFSLPGPTIAAVPALAKLALDFFATPVTFPRLSHGHDRSESFLKHILSFHIPLVIHHPKLRPALDWRELAGYTREVHVLDHTLDPVTLQNILEMAYHK